MENKEPRSNKRHSCIVHQVSNDKSCRFGFLRDLSVFPTFSRKKEKKRWANVEQTRLSKGIFEHGFLLQTLNIPRILLFLHGELCQSRYGFLPGRSSLLSSLESNEKTHPRTHTKPWNCTFLTAFRIRSRTNQLYPFSLTSAWVETTEMEEVGRFKVKKGVLLLLLCFSFIRCKERERERETCIENSLLTFNEQCEEAIPSVWVEKREDRGGDFLTTTGTL